MKKFIAFTTILFATCISASATEYLRPCYDDNSDYLQTQLQTNNTAWTLTYTAFEDKNCATPYLHYEVKYLARQSSHNLDLVTQEVSYTALSELVSEVLNQINYCGFTDWKVFEKKIVTGKICDEFQTPKFGEVLYSIFAVKNEGKNLFLGAPSGYFDGKSPERRYQDLDPLGFVLLP